MSEEYQSYCSNQAPDSSPVDQFICILTESFCNRTRENVSSCPHLRDLEKITDINEYLADSPPLPGANPPEPFP